MSEVLADSFFSTMPKHSNEAWKQAQRRFHLSSRHIAMAKQLGMNPKKFGKYSANQFEPWKSPLAGFIERCLRQAV